MNGTRAMGRLLLVVPMLAAALAFGSVRPAAAAFSCDTYYENMTIATSIVVPDGAACTLDGVVVRGGVSVGAGAGFEALFSEIRGNVSGANVAYIELDITTVRGNVSVSGASDEVSMNGGAQVRGNVAISGTAYADVSGATVSGSVTLSDLGPGAFASVENATIRANLICSNVPGGITGLASASVGSRVIRSNCPDLGGI